MKKIIALTLGIFMAVTAFSQNISGSWNGLLDVGMAKLHVVFNFEEHGGTWSATMDSPDQGAKGIPVRSVIFDGIRVLVDNQNLMYEGSLEGDSIRGVFKQGGQAWPLVLARGGVVQNRPQTPQPPYPYNSQDVQFENKAAGITLAGTLTWPKEGTNFPVAVMVTGSGPQNRDEELFGHKPFLVLADYLTRHGIAVLRYDDRGTALSGGVYGTATMQDFASDATAAIAWLKTRKEINPKKIGVIGHSEGGSIAFMLAAEDHSLAYIVSLAGCAVKGDSLMKAQRYAISRQAGVSDAAIAQNELFVSAMATLVETYSADSVLQNLGRYAAELLPGQMRDNPAALRNVAVELRKMAMPEIRSFMSYDPAADLRKITCPVFALDGDKDLQVPADMNLGQIKALVKGSVRVKTYPGLNHLFQHCTTGLMDEYGVIEQTMAPEVLEDIASWIVKVVK